jgi:MscS family membrane protein
MLELTWSDVLALSFSAVIAVLGGRLLGRWTHGSLYRLSIVARLPEDDRFVLRLAGPLALLFVVVVWHVMLSLWTLPASVEASCRLVGHVGLLIALAWGAMRALDTAADALALRSSWLAGARLSRALVPLGRRVTKALVGTVVGIMILAILGYTVAPLLVVLAIVGLAFALASHRPMENLLAAYAIFGDHAIREGDFVRLDSGIAGTIEAIGLYSTRMRTADGSFLIVPNRRLADTQIERVPARAQTHAHAAPPPPDLTHVDPS